MNRGVFNFGSLRRLLSAKISARTALLTALLFGCTICRCWCVTPVILSTDIGNEIDDQWAIAYLLTNPDFNVLGILSAHAPSLPDPSAHISYLLLKDEVEDHLGMTVHPPLFEGASLALENVSTPRRNAAVQFLIDASRNFSSTNRLTIVTIGAATDVASAILIDPTIVDRLRIVAMAFTDAKSGDEYNVANDVAAWQVLLRAHVPVVIGSGDVCRADLALNFDEAQKLLAGHGPIAAWLWDEYRFWYFRQVKPLRRQDFSKPWMIWDIITLAYLEGMTTEEVIPRPQLNSNMSLGQPDTQQTVTWITHVDSQRLWPDFQKKLDAWDRTYALQYSHGPDGPLQ